MLKGGNFVINDVITSNRITDTSFNSDMYFSTGGTVTLNAQNTYFGNTFIDTNTTVQNGISNALPTDTVLTLGENSGNTNGLLDLHSFNQTIAGLTTSGTGTGNVTVNSGGVLSGSGIIAPNTTSGVTVAAGGELNPGADPTGTAAVGHLTLTSASGATSPVLTLATPATSGGQGQLQFDLGSGVNGITFFGANVGRSQSGGQQRLYQSDQQCGGRGGLQQ